MSTEVAQPVLRRHSMLRREGVQLVRYLFLVVIVLLIHFKGQKLHRQLLSEERPPLTAHVHQPVYHVPAEQGRLISETPMTWEILDEQKKILGYAFETSIAGQESIGFSGPTNLLVFTDQARKILHLFILKSLDSPEHVQMVKNDPGFLSQFEGKSISEVTSMQHIDAVSGATLTSYAIFDSLLFSAGKQKLVSSRFHDQIELSRLKEFVPEAVSIIPDPQYQSLMRIVDKKYKNIGWLLRTSPVADQVIGYQGPTDTWVIFGNDRKVMGIIIGSTYDNKPYIDYVRAEDSFKSHFKGKSQEDLAYMTLDISGIEGVSGATMTSQAITESIFKAAAANMDSKNQKQKKTRLTGSFISISLRDYLFFGLIFFTVIFSLTMLRSFKYARIILRLVVIGYIGIYYGGLLSQAMWIGWIKYGIPLKHALGFVVLSVVAVSFPVFVRSNIYCHHLCPHGGLQQLVKPTKPRFQFLAPYIKYLKTMKYIPGILLLAVVFVSITDFKFSLVNLEPFDAYLIKTASVAAISIFVVGVILSTVEPMAYCRYGCPTGTLLDYLRRHPRNGNIGRADIVLIVALGIAVAGYFL